MCSRACHYWCWTPVEGGEVGGVPQGAKETYGAVYFHINSMYRVYQAAPYQVSEIVIAG